MPWPIRLLDTPGWEGRQIGDAWWAPATGNAWATRVGARHQHLAQVLWVLLPGRAGGIPFCVHSPASREGVEQGSGWEVTGEAPAITVSPSVNIVDSYHGWIQAGVISDDCEGRRFRSDGSPE